MVAPVSPAALIISTATSDGPAALPDFILDMAFFTISIVIGMGGPSSLKHRKCKVKYYRLFRNAYTANEQSTSQNATMSECITLLLTKIVSLDLRF